MARKSKPEPCVCLRFTELVLVTDSHTSPSTSVQSQAASIISVQKSPTFRNVTYNFPAKNWPGISLQLTFYFVHAMKFCSLTWGFLSLFPVEHHLATNVQRNRLVQHDLKVAKKLQEEEDLKARAQKHQKDL